MTNDQIIHEARGLCWHKATFQMTNCIKCGENVDFQKSLNPDYSKWEYYGPMLEWAMNQEWWERYITILSFKSDWKMLDVILNPTRGRDAIAEFVLANPEYFEGKEDEN